MGKTLTEEQRAKHREACRKWRAKNPEKVKEYNRQWKAENKDHVKEYQRQWRAENPNYDKEWRNENKDEIAERINEYRSTPRGRALYLLCAYNQQDRRAGRVQGDLTIEQVEELIQQPCAHCRSSRMGYNWSKSFRQ